MIVRADNMIVRKPRIKRVRSSGGEAWWECRVPGAGNAGYGRTVVEAFGYWRGSLSSRA